MISIRLFRDSKEREREENWSSEHGFLGGYNKKNSGAIVCEGEETREGERERERDNGGLHRTPTAFVHSCAIVSR